MQKLEVDLGMDMGGEHKFYNPFSGENLLNEDIVNNPPENILMMLHWQVIYEPMVMKPEVKDIFSSFLSKYEDQDDESADMNLEEFFDSLSKYFSDDDFFLIHLTMGGMACGPVWDTVSYLIKK